jgi:hypothetical protein
LRRRFVEGSADFKAMRKLRVASSVRYDTEAEFMLTNRRLIQHVLRLEYGRLKESIDWDSIVARDFIKIAEVHYLLLQMAVAREGYEKVLGPEAPWAVDVHFVAVSC